MKQHKSQYDPSRDTVGKIYRDLQLHQKGDEILVGDMSNSQMKDLVDDINEGLALDPYDGKPFYLLIHEKRDLQMKMAQLRRRFTFSYRPYPEDDTTVFWKNPKTQEVRFCWSIPHWSEMDNILMNAHNFDENLVKQIKAWKDVDLTKFGFYYHKEHKWVPNPKHKDQVIKST